MSVFFTLFDDLRRQSRRVEFDVSDEFRGPSGSAVDSAKWSC